MHRSRKAGLSVLPVAAKKHRREDLHKLQLLFGQPCCLLDVLRLCFRVLGGEFASTNSSGIPELAMPGIWLSKLFDVRQGYWLDIEPCLFARFAVRRFFQALDSLDAATG